MKQIAILFLLFIIGKTNAQPPLVMPPDAVPGKGYAQCLWYDSIYIKEQHGPIVAPVGWDVFLLEKTTKYLRFELELPIFDTVLIKIPVDKTTRMANIPDEYGLTMEPTIVKEPAFSWVYFQREKECLSAEPADCLMLALIEVPTEYKKVQKRVLKATAHQRRYDDVDTVVFKQVIEVKALKKTPIEVPPQYEKVFRKTHPHTYYYEWREVLCSGGYRKIALEVQHALKDRGYYEGPFDNILGESTKKAIRRFQKDHHLKTGNLTDETLRALGLSSFNSKYH
jgi:Putative peptidoglycan binding domain